jgi:Cu(I)/Ag(I) efflux system membrane fusion protein
VKVGQVATLELAAFPGETFKGKVQFLAPTIDAGSRTMRVRVELPNRGGRLRPGMYGTLDLALSAAAKAQPAVVVPAEAVVDTGDAQYLFVAKDGGRYEPRRIETGARADDEVEILKGVAEGELVVTTGNFLVDSESRLRAAVEGQATVPAAPAGHEGHQGQ